MAFHSTENLGGDVDGGSKSTRAKQGDSGACRGGNINQPKDTTVSSARTTHGPPVVVLEAYTPYFRQSLPGRGSCAVLRAGTGLTPHILTPTVYHPTHQGRASCEAPLANWAVLSLHRSWLGGAVLEQMGLERLLCHVTNAGGSVVVRASVRVRAFGDRPGKALAAIRGVARRGVANEGEGNMLDGGLVGCRVLVQEEIWYPAGSGFGLVSVSGSVLSRSRFRFRFRFRCRLRSVGVPSGFNIGSCFGFGFGAGSSLT